MKNLMLLAFLLFSYNLMAQSSVILNSVEDPKYFLSLKEPKSSDYEDFFKSVKKPSIEHYVNLLNSFERSKDPSVKSFVKYAHDKFEEAHHKTYMKGLGKAFPTYVESIQKFSQAENKECVGFEGCTRDGKNSIICGNDIYHVTGQVDGSNIRVNTKADAVESNSPKKSSPKTKQE